MISDIRTDLKIDDLSFIAGDLGEFYGKGAQDERAESITKVRDALKSLPEKVKNTAFVKTTGLKARRDRVHSSREAYIALGKRYAEVYEKVTQK